MLVAIDPSVLDSGDDAVMRHLDRLLMLFESGQHEWFLKEDVDTIMSFKWPEQLSERHKKILREIAVKSFVKSGNISANERKNRGVTTIENDGGVDNYLFLLDSPLVVVVENETSDKVFLTRIFEVFPSPGKLLLNSLTKTHMSFYPTGGRTETIKTLTNLKSKQRGAFAPRIFLFVDSDKCYPDETMSQGLKNIIDFCEARRIGYHVTYKREIENYIPREVLERNIPEFLSEVLSEFLRLTPHQWDFFDLEKGFNNRDQDQNGLYGNYSERKSAQWEALRKGFQHKDFNPKRELYLFVKDEAFTLNNLNARCAHQPNKNELLDLLNNINNLL